jgi:phosphoadenosine phosphosulfate reductase
MSVVGHEQAAIHRIEWATRLFDSVMITTGLNLSGSVLIHLASRSNFSGEVAFVDTGYHFDETLQTWKETEARYPAMTFTTLGSGRNLDTLYKTDPTRCCELNKIAPLVDFLDQRSPGALLNARTRESAPDRVSLEVVEIGRPTRVNPLVDWTREELEAYAIRYDVPVNTLYYDNYLSIGCAPCTEPVRDGYDPRSGRFVGQGRTECGIWTHVSLDANTPQGVTQ